MIIMIIIIRRRKRRINNKKYRPENMHFSLLVVPSKATSDVGVDHMREAGRHFGAERGRC